MSDCEHEKVYSMQLLTSFPPQREWICRKCGAEGYEFVGPPVSFADEYSALKLKFMEQNREKDL